MKALINFLKSRYFLIGFGMVLLIAGVLILGAWLAWSMTVQLLAIIGILVVCVLVLALSMARANKSAALIEQSIKSQAAQQRMSSRPDRAAEVEELQKQLEAAIEKLKSSKLGRGRSGKAALYALPWYLFIGPPGTGKTTAIANSGLNFPLGTNRIRGVGGTRNCDWFFTDSAILLDTAGRYMTEAEDTEEWHAFLETLKKHRPDRPINGIVVGISMSDLAGSSVDEIEWHAANIRHRIDELLGRLGVRFPVYLLFTKCDLLQGFVEYFGEMAKKEREQIWGCTLDHEQQRNPDIRAVFDREYQNLYEVLLNMRTNRLGQAMKREERHKVYVFPLEFASVRDNLSLFVSRLFQPNPYQESPVFRGFYLTSGTQEGAPIDRVIQAIAQQFDLPPTVEMGGYDAEVETKSYFIKDLFTDVIVPDQYMVRQTSRSANRGRMARAGVAVAALVVLALFAIATSQALIRSMSDLGATQTAATLVEPVRWADPTSLEDELTRMDGLREQVAGLEAYDESPPLLRLGLYRGGTVLEPARKLYFDRVRTFIDGYAMRSIENRLGGAAGTVMNAQSSERDSLYNDLRAYLLMTSETAQLQEEVNAAFLTRYLTALTGREAAYRVSPGSEQAAMEQLQRQAHAYALGLSRGVVAPFESNTGMVAQVRRLIYEPPSVQRIYDRMKEEAQVRLTPLTLSDVLQGRYLELFATRPEVPGFFTKTGWQTYVEQAIQAETAAPDRVDWVMGYVEEDLPESMSNPAELGAQLEDIYFNEYAAQWERFLGSIRLNRFTDMRSASRFLTDLGNPYDSPLLYVLAQVTVQTQFGGGVAADLTDKAGNVVERKIEQKTRNLFGREGEIERDEAETLHLVDRRFKRLHDLNADKAQSGGASPALLRALESLGKVGSTLEGMAGDGAKSADYAQKILQGDGGELRSHAETIQSALSLLDPEIRTALFVQPIYSAWETILVETRQFLNDQWQDQVIRTYQERLAGRYPLDLSSDTDAAIDDFERFFQPQTGALPTFFSTTLAPFLARDGRSSRAWEGRGIAIAPAVFAARDQAKHIGEGLFSGGVLRLDFEMQPDQPVRTNPNAPAVSGVEIDLHGRINSYGMGSYRPWTQFVWPGRAGASLRLATQSGPVSLELPGDWALFRMLQAANPQRRSATEYEIQWPLSGGITARYILRTKSSNNPFSDPRAFFNFDLPASLVQ